MTTLSRPARGDSLMNISILAGISSEDYNALYVSGDGYLCSQGMVWNSSSLAWEAAITNKALADILAKLEQIRIQLGGTP